MAAEHRGCFLPDPGSWRQGCELSVQAVWPRYQTTSEESTVYSLHSWDLNPLSGVWFADSLAHFSIGCLFILLKVSLAVQLFSLMWLHLIFCFSKVNVKAVYRMLQVHVTCGLQSRNIQLQSISACRINQKIACLAPIDSRTCFTMNNSHYILKWL